MKQLMIFDLDGTLYDTSKVNFYAYKEALALFKINLDYDYFRSKCNGNSYLAFLPEIMGEKQIYIEAVHKTKKKLYSKYLEQAIRNNHLFKIAYSMKDFYHMAVVTTASMDNCYELLDYFKDKDVFDLILTKEDYHPTKPSPAGFIKTMDYFKVLPEDTIIFEDSTIGIEAAAKSGANYYQVFGFR